MPAKGVEELVVRRPVKDRYGDVTGEAAVAYQDQAILWPRAATETGDRGVVTIEGLHVFVPDGRTTWDPAVPPAERVIQSSDVITARDLRWEIDEAVGDWRKKTGKKVGLLYEVKRRA